LDFGHFGFWTFWILDILEHFGSDFKQLRYIQNHTSWIDDTDRQTMTDRQKTKGQ